MHAADDIVVEPSGDQSASTTGDTATLLSRRRIAIISSLYHPIHVGGAELTAQQVAEGLANRGNTVAVITLARQGDDLTGHHNGISIYRVPLANIYWAFPRPPKMLMTRALWHAIDTFNLRAGGAVGRILQELKPDVVQTHNLAGFSTAVWFALHQMRLPIAHVIHDYYLLCPKSSMFRNGAICERQCTRCHVLRTPQRVVSCLVDAVVGVSRFVLDAHLKAGLFSKATVRTVINNGYDRQSARPNRKAPEPGLPLRVGYLGQLHPTKGLEVLLDAFSGLSRERFSLVIGGTGAESYVSQLTARRRQPNVRFLGKVRPSEFFQQIDMLAVPSVWNEPFGRIVIEAYAHGLPVVGSRSGGISEIIEDGATGYLFAAGDSAALRGAIEKMSEPELRLAMGERAWVKGGEFSMHSAINRYEAMHTELLAKTR